MAITETALTFFTWIWMSVLYEPPPNEMRIKRADFAISSLAFNNREQSTSILTRVSTHLYSLAFIAFHSVGMKSSTLFPDVQC